MSLMRPFPDCVGLRGQGEEADVIILSLVRSNSRGDIGFLSVQNRMVVALSRARHCLYILGNGAMLSRASPLWRSVLAQLSREGCVGPALPVLGGRPQRVIEAASVLDWNVVASAGGYPKPAAAAAAKRDGRDVMQ